MLQLLWFVSLPVSSKDMHLTLQWFMSIRLILVGPWDSYLGELVKGGRRGGLKINKLQGVTLFIWGLENVFPSGDG